ncbi:MAG: hypothetical protein JWR10_3647 [Rubritepida sp.]|nr:hypothetical protein [Rubritepida sp.]
MSDDLQKRFADEIERQMEARWHDSSLGAWMADHHDEVAALLRTGAMNWASAAAAFGWKGLRAAGGKIPDAKAAEETWKRVNALRQNRAVALKGKPQSRPKT